MTKNTFADRVRSIGERTNSRIITTIALILLTLVNAINVAFLQVPLITVVLGTIIIVVWALDIRLMYLSRKTNPKDVWSTTPSDAKRIPIAITVLISLIGFYAFGWLHMGLWMWVLLTYAGIQLAYRILLVILQNASDELFDYIERGTYCLAIVVSLLGIASVHNNMKGLPMIGFLLGLVPFIAGIMGRKERSFFALKLIWLILMWVGVICKGSVIDAILATVLFGMMISYSNDMPIFSSSPRQPSHHEPEGDNVISFPSGTNTTSQPEDNTDPNYEDGILLSFHPNIPYTWIPNPFRKIWVEKDGNRIELFDWHLFQGENSVDLINFGDIDCKSNVLLSFSGLFMLRYVLIRVSGDKPVKFYLFTNFGQKVKRKIDRWTDWTCSQRKISRMRRS